MALFYFDLETFSQVPHKLLLDKENKEYQNSSKSEVQLHRWSCKLVIQRDQTIIEIRVTCKTHLEDKFFSVIVPPQVNHEGQVLRLQFPWENRSKVI